MKFSNSILIITVCLSSIIISAQECDTKLIVESDFSETYYYLNDTLVGTGSRIEINVTPESEAPIIPNETTYQGDFLFPTKNPALFAFRPVK